MVIFYFLTDIYDILGGIAAPAVSASNMDMHIDALNVRCFVLRSHHSFSSFFYF